MHFGYCLVASLFIGASLYTMFTCEQCHPFSTYKQSLKPNQLALYQIVAKERMNKAMYGLLFGVILAFLFLFFFRKTLNPFANGCAFATITLGTQYLYYILSPKMSMLPHLANMQQVELWYDVYKFMQYRYHFGMLLGLIGYFLLAFALA